MEKKGVTAVSAEARRLGKGTCGSGESRTKKSAVRCSAFLGWARKKIWSEKDGGEIVVSTQTSPQAMVSRAFGGGAGGKGWEVCGTMLGVQLGACTQNEGGLKLAGQWEVPGLAKISDCTSAGLCGCLYY